MHLVAIGGSDAGISAALRARELDPDAELTVIVADAYPNYSICGIPYHLSGEVPHVDDLAHRTREELESSGITLMLDTAATRIDVADRQVELRAAGGRDDTVGYDKLVIGTGALSVRPPIDGLSGEDALGPDDGVHLLHSIGDMRAVTATIEQRQPRSAVVIGAGYIGLEMADALTLRGMAVTQIEALPEVLPTVEPEIGAIVHRELGDHGVEVLTGTTVTAIERSADALNVHARRADGTEIARTTALVIVVVGVRPDTTLAAAAGARLGVKGAIEVDRHMRTNLPDVFAAGDCAITHHRQLGTTWLPLGTTAHKQGRVAGENALGGNRQYAGSLGTQVVKVFDLAVARTGLLAHEATAAGMNARTEQTVADDHKAYYPGAHPITIRVTGDTDAGRLLGAQLIGHRDASIAKRVDIYATAIHGGLTVDEISDLDLSYTPPLGSPWDAVQAATQTWTRSGMPTQPLETTAQP